MTLPPDASNLPWGLTFEPSAGDGAVEVRFDTGSGRLLVMLRNEGDDVLRPDDLRLASAIDLPAISGSMWIHGRYMQMDALVRRFGEESPAGYDGRFLRIGDDSRTYVSREVATLNLPVRSTPVLLAGSLRMDRFFLDVEVEVDSDEEEVLGLALVFDLRGAEIAPGESLELPPVLLLQGSDPVALIEQYADEVAREMAARVPDHVPSGWCSWYYFYNRVSEVDIVSNLETMRATNHPAEFVQIDDGYQSRTGDWLVPNEKFPSGMKALAGRIREAGYRPGLWLAPFVLHEDSVALREHPGMVLRRPDGEPLFVETWLGRCAVLDCTNPEAESWLRHTIGTVVEEWGYAYLKLDALTFAARSPREVQYHVPGTTASANLRRGLEIIRGAAGEGTFILGCTCHFGPAIGLVDAMRVGPDVKERWEDGPNPSVRHAMRLTLQRNWMHNRWWANDPDCLIVRDTDTGLSEAEVRFLATGIALSGGMVVASDDLPKLPPERRALAESLFPPVGVAARPVDPTEAPVPSAWRTRLSDERSLVGVLNWTDAPRWVAAAEHLAPGEIAFDPWRAKLQGKGDVLLAPHEGVLWQVAAPGPTPRVAGDSGSVTFARLYQRQVSGRLQVRNDGPAPRTLAIEARGNVFEAELQPGEMRWFD